jgi:serine/threonine-protein kinase
LAELVSGVRPFDGASPVETMDRIRLGTPDLTGMPDDLVAFVSRCLQRDPGARHGNMLAVLDALRTLRRARAPAGPGELARWLATSAAPSE